MIPAPRVRRRIQENGFSSEEGTTTTSKVIINSDNEEEEGNMNENISREFIGQNEIHSSGSMKLDDKMTESNNTNYNCDIVRVSRETNKDDEQDLNNKIIMEQENVFISEELEEEGELEEEEELEDEDEFYNRLDTIVEEDDDNDDENNDNQQVGNRGIEMKTKETNARYKTKQINDISSNKMLVVCDDNVDSFDEKNQQLAHKEFPPIKSSQVPITLSEDIKQQTLVDTSRNNNNKALISNQRQQQQQQDQLVNSRQQLNSNQINRITNNNNKLPYLMWIDKTQIPSTNRLISEHQAREQQALFKALRERQKLRDQLGTNGSEDFLSASSWLPQLRTNKSTNDTKRSDNNNKRRSNRRHRNGHRSKDYRKRRQEEKRRCNDNEAEGIPLSSVDLSSMSDRMLDDLLVNIAPASSSSSLSSNSEGNSLASSELSSSDINQDSSICSSSSGSSSNASSDNDDEDETSNNNNNKIKQDYKSCSTISHQQQQQQQHLQKSNANKLSKHGSHHNQKTNSNRARARTRRGRDSNDLSDSSEATDQNQSSSSHERRHYQRQGANKSQTTSFSAQQQHQQHLHLHQHQHQHQQQQQQQQLDWLPNIVGVHDEESSSCLLADDEQKRKSKQQLLNCRDATKRRNNKDDFDDDADRDFDRDHTNQLNVRISGACSGSGSTGGVASYTGTSCNGNEQQLSLSPPVAQSINTDLSSATSPRIGALSSIFGHSQRRPESSASTSTNISNSMFNNNMNRLNLLAVSSNHSSNSQQQNPHPHPHSHHQEQLQQQQQLDEFNNKTIPIQTTATNEQRSVEAILMAMLTKLTELDGSDVVEQRGDKLNDLLRNGLGQIEQILNCSLSPPSGVHGSNSSKIFESVNKCSSSSTSSNVASAIQSNVSLLSKDSDYGSDTQSGADCFSSHLTIGGSNSSSRSQTDSPSLVNNNNNTREQVQGTSGSNMIGNNNHNNHNNNNSSSHKMPLLSPLAAELSEKLFETLLRLNQPQRVNSEHIVTLDDGTDHMRHDEPSSIISVANNGDQFGTMRNGGTRRGNRSVVKINASPMSPSLSISQPQSRVGSATFDIEDSSNSSSSSLKGRNMIMALSSRDDNETEPTRPRSSVNIINSSPDDYTSPSPTRAAFSKNVSRININSYNGQARVSNVHELLPGSAESAHNDNNNIKCNEIYDELDKRSLILGKPRDDNDEIEDKTRSVVVVGEGEEGREREREREIGEVQVTKASNAGRIISSAATIINLNQSSKSVEPFERQVQFRRSSRSSIRRRASIKRQTSSAASRAGSPIPRSILEQQLELEEQKKQQQQQAMSELEVEPENEILSNADTTSSGNKSQNNNNNNKQRQLQRALILAQKYNYSPAKLATSKLGAKLQLNGQISGIKGGKLQKHGTGEITGTGATTSTSTTTTTTLTATSDRQLGGTLLTSSQRLQSKQQIVQVTGQVQLDISYVAKSGSLIVHVIQCSQLVFLSSNSKRRSNCNPYVKLYLLPDRSRLGKRKSGVIKCNLNPKFDESFTFGPIQLAQFDQRVLWLTVWHYSSRLGKTNEIIGELQLPLALVRQQLFASDFCQSTTPKWYPIQTTKILQPSEILSSAARRLSQIDSGANCDESGDIYCLKREDQVRESKSNCGQQMELGANDNKYNEHDLSSIVIDNDRISSKTSSSVVSTLNRSLVRSSLADTQTDTQSGDGTSLLNDMQNSGPQISGQLFVALKFVPNNSNSNNNSLNETNNNNNNNSNGSLIGDLHVNIKEAHGIGGFIFSSILAAAASMGTSNSTSPSLAQLPSGPLPNAFAKCYLVNGIGNKLNKFKTNIIKRSANPKWDQTRIFNGLKLDDLKDISLDINLFNSSDSILVSSNSYLGGVRLGSMKTLDNNNIISIKNDSINMMIDQNAMRTTSRVSCKSGPLVVDEKSNNKDIISIDNNSNSNSNNNNNLEDTSNNNSSIITITERESRLWTNMLNKPNIWSYGELNLRNLSNNHHDHHHHH